jgi:uncharacterized protein YjbI with pentapeptide repeats
VKPKGLRGSNLSGLNLSRLYLVGFDFGATVLNYVDFSHSYLAKARFDDAKLFGTNFKGALFNPRQLLRTIHGLQLTPSSRSYCFSFSGCNFTGLDLRGLNLTGSDFTGCILSEALLDRTALDGSSLRGAVFRNCSMFQTSMKDADTTEADFTDAHTIAASPYKVFNPSEANEMHVQSNNGKCHLK